MWHRPVNMQWMEEAI